jgi:SOS-response transcriptional repressor LexA
MEFSTFLKRRMKELGLTSIELAKRLNVSRPLISKWLTGRGRPTLDMVDRLAAVLNVHPLRLLEALGVEIPLMESQLINVYILPGGLPCGTPRESIMDYVEDIIKVQSEGFGLNPNCVYYGIRARGNSMIGKGIFDGYLVIFTPDLEVLNGDVAIVWVGEGLCARIVRYYQDYILLLAANQAYEPIAVPKNEEFRILGKVVGVQGNPNKVIMDNSV